MYYVVIVINILEALFIIGSLGSLGYNFMMVFPQNDDSNMHPRLVLTRYENLDTQIDITELDFSTIIGQVDLFGSTKSQMFLVDTTRQYKKASHIMEYAVIHATSDHAFSVVVNIQGHSNDGSYLGLDCDQITKQYFVFTFDLGLHDPEMETSAYIVLGAHYGLNAQIFLPFSTSDELIEFEGSFYGSRDVIQVTLLDDQSLQIQSKFDLTGTRIESDLKMFVIAGLNKTRIGGKNSTTSHVTELMPPLISGGRSYVLVPAPVTSRPSTFRFINVYTATQITVYSEGGNQNFYLSHPGSYAEVMCGWPGKYCYAESTKDILAYRLAPSTPTDQYGDAAMTVLIPTDRDIDSFYRLTIPNNIPPRQTLLTIVITKGNVSGLRQDGISFCSQTNPPPCVTATYFDVTGSDVLVAVVLNLTSIPALQTVTWSHQNSSEFMAYVDSFNRDEGEGYPLGYVNVQDQAYVIEFPDTDQCCVSIDASGFAKEDDECTQQNGNILTVDCCVLNGDVLPCKVRSYKKSCQLQDYRKMTSNESIVIASNFLECQNICEQMTACSGANFLFPRRCHLILGATYGLSTSAPGHFIHCWYGASLDIMM